MVNSLVGRKTIGRLLLGAVLALALASCSYRDIGQTIYNSGKAYCDHNPRVCGGARD